MLLAKQRKKEKWFEYYGANKARTYTLRPYPMSHLKKRKRKEEVYHADGFDNMNSVFIHSVQRHQYTIRIIKSWTKCWRAFKSSIA